MNQHADVVIVGAGVIGLTTAYFLRRSGARVTVLDKGSPGQESSWAGAGIIPAAPSLARATDPVDQLAALSAELFPALTEELRSTGVDNGYLVRGAWNLFAGDETLPRALWEQQEIAYEIVTEPTLRLREPQLRVGRAQVVYFPRTAQVRNPRHLAALQSWCGLHGVTVLSGCPVHGFVQQGQRVVAVRSALGEHHADHFLVAAGAWTDGLLESLGVRSGVHPVRGQIALLHSPAPVLNAIVEVGKRYLVPRPDGRVLIGATEEHVGFDKSTTAAAIAGLLHFGLDLVPALAEATMERCWAGLRPGNRTGKPVLGLIPDFANLYVAAGHFRAGIQLSPATGLLLSQLLLGQAPRIALEPFRLLRPERIPG